jgi:hypothetical protein
VTGADPTRTTLLRAQADARGRVEIATNAVVRVIAGGCSWNDERAKAHRSACGMAIVDLDIATRALAMLDEINAQEVQ